MTMGRGWREWLPFVAVVWLVGYGAVRVWWALGHAPTFEVIDRESYFDAPWLPVALAAGSVVASTLAIRRRAPSVAAVVGWLSGAGLLAYSFLFALDLASFLLPWGSVDGVGLAARGSGVVAGVLTVVIAVGQLRAARGACERCGRVHGRSPERRTDPTPWWAWAAGYAAMAGCLSRFVAQAITGFPGQDVRALFTPLVNAFTVFAFLMLVAGTLLPLALVHRWGRIWPRWVRPFAGQNVPRWLVLVPALFMGAGLTGYFGLAGIHATLTQGIGEYPVWWEVAVIGGYTVWGLGLLLAALSYYTLTKPAHDDGPQYADAGRRLRPGGRPGLQHR
jgi:hypothetical protein